MTSSNIAIRKFIDLDRKFTRVFPEKSSDEDEFGFGALKHSQQLAWHDLLNEYRVVILAEAGSGKTYELLNAAEKLHRSGKKVFFLRIERLSTGLRYAFDVGSFAEFQAWLETPEEGWLFLDSVDEARLRDPRDFANALRILAQEARRGLQRAHIFISCRTSAWRRKTDVDLVESEMPYYQRRESNTPTPRAINDVAPTDEEVESIESNEPLAPMVLQIADLSRVQIELYSKKKGVANVSDFLDAVTRANAWALTSRPQDLDELVEFWNTTGRLGSRQEVLTNSIQRRLTERDQDRSALQTLNFDEAYSGAQLLAAATTLCKTQDIAVPDGSREIDCISSADLLGDWVEKKYGELLERPIFELGRYGAVRFHHRTVREYLAAEWFLKLLNSTTSRRRIESLLFCDKYGIDVVIPNLRPLLPWLAIKDTAIRQRLLELEPSILLEGGDPSRLPSDVQKDLIGRVCRQLNNREISLLSNIFGAAGYLASAEISPEVVQALDKYSGVEDVEWFLLQIVWQGRLVGALSQVESITLSEASPADVRRLALRTLSAISSANEVKRVCQSILSETLEVDRNIVAEVIDSLQRTPTIIDFSVLLKNSSRFLGTRMDDLTDRLISFGENVDLTTLPRHINEISELLDQSPFLSSQVIEVSDKFYWLLLPLCKWIERLVENRVSDCLGASTLDKINRVSQAQRLRYIDGMDFQTQLSKLVPAWGELNRALFWHVIESTRMSEKRELRERALFQGRVVGCSLFESFWHFDTSDFDYFIQELQRRTEEDEKAAALSVAFCLYKSEGRPRKWKNQLSKAVANDSELLRLLNALLRSPRQSDVIRLHKREEARWRREQKRRAESAYNNVLAWKKWFSDNLKREISLLQQSPGSTTNAMAYLFEVQSAKRPSKTLWANGDWRSLVAEYGADVAQFYRETMVNHWRHYTPVLRSEGAPANSTPYPVIFGLIGLEIESAEQPAWPQALTEEEALLACRYASLELNGFPAWFERLYGLFPNIVSSFLLGEVRFEVNRDSSAERLHYILDDVVWSGKWLWEGLAPGILTLLYETKTLDAINLTKLLNILQHSSLSNEQVERLAEKKALASNASIQPIWFAVLMGVAPETTMPKLRVRLAELQNHDQRVSFAVSFISNLLGNRGNDFSGARDLFQTTEYLTDLYLFAHDFIRRDEDIDRVGKGAYIPGERDTAQESRSQLFNLLLEQPAKEVVFKLKKMAGSFPDESLRPVFAMHAKTIAERSSEFDAWSEKQVREFSDKYERTPRNHKELAELAVLRLLDLKDDLENGDNSDAGLFWNRKGIKEIEVRNYIAGKLKDMALGRYTISSEDELADGKKPDIRFQSTGFDGPVPVELKLANKWKGSKLFERLENQLCGDYLRDNRSNRGIYLLVYQESDSWKLPNTSVESDFATLVEGLKSHWDAISPKFPSIEDVTIIGIDLSLRKT